MSKYTAKWESFVYTSYSTVEEFGHTLVAAQTWYIPFGTNYSAVIAILAGDSPLVWGLAGNVSHTDHTVNWYTHGIGVCL